MMCHPEATAVTSMLISFSLLDTNKLDSVVKNFISSFSTFLQICCKLNKREKVNNSTDNVNKQTSQTNKSNKRTKKIKLTYLSKEQTKLREKCCKKFKRMIQEEDEIFQKDHSGNIFSLSSFFFLFWLNFNPMKKKIGRIQIRGKCVTLNAISESSIR